MLYVGSSGGDTPDVQHAVLITEILVDQVNGRNTTSDYATRPQDLYYRVMDPWIGGCGELVDAANIPFYFARQRRGTENYSFQGGYLFYASSPQRSSPHRNFEF